MTQQETLHLVNIWKLCRKCKEDIFSNAAIELATELNNSMFTQSQRKKSSLMYAYIRCNKEEFENCILEKVRDLDLGRVPLDFLWMFIDANVYVKSEWKECNWHHRSMLAMEEFYSERGEVHEN